MKKKDLTIIFIIVLLALLLVGGSLLYNKILKNKSNKDIDLTETEKNIAIKPAETEEQKEESEGNYRDFTVYTEDGTAVKLSEKVNKGKPVIINFWTTWCGFCKQEMPDFNECYNEYGDKVEFMMVDICGQGQDDRTSAQEYVKEEAFDFPVYYDDDLSALQSYYTTGYPTTIVIDSSKNIVYAQSGALTKEQLVGMIEQLI